MTHSLYINQSVLLANNQVWVNGTRVMDQKGDQQDFKNFTKSLYRYCGLKYQKFFKLDNLSKLGFLGAEIALQHVSLDQYNPDEIGIVFSNSQSTLYTDQQYQNTISQIPSPALFVYTLPNILMGEICIKNHIKGENIFFISEKFDAHLLAQQVNLLFEHTPTQMCLTGWVNFVDLDNYELSVQIVQKEPAGDGLKFNAENLNQIYNKLNT